MREREAVSKVARSVPPPELRLFTDPSRPWYQGTDLGVNAFADRAAWLAARQEWERVNGLGLREWFDELMAETLEAGATLNELNAAFSTYLTEDDDEDQAFTDPRLPAA